MTTDTPTSRFEDRLLDALEQFLAQASFPVAEPARSRPRARLVALAAVPTALAVVALLVVPSLDGGRAQLAQAAVLTRAAAALDQPGAILDLHEQDYNSTGLGPCMLGLGTPPRCIQGPTGTPQTPISADPAQDTLTYSAQEWLSADGSVQRTLYGDGTEVVTNTGADEYSIYDPADNTLTTLTAMGDTGPSAPSEPSDPALAAAPSAIIGNLANPSFYEQLYQEAQAGGAQNNGQTAVTSQLLGQTTIGGESVYELRFDLHFIPPANPPAGDMCGSSVCSPPDQEILLYLDSQAFTPVRTVISLVNTSDRPGIPPGTTVWTVADYSVDRLADTPENEALLQMSAHPGATQVQETYAQYRAAQGWPPLAADAAKLARRR